MALEIERKFLLPTMPPLEVYRDQNIAPCIIITQAYLAAGDNEEVRLRCAGGRCFLTVKHGAGLQRREVETPIERATFEHLMSKSTGQVVKKYRYLIQDNGQRLELDEFTGQLSGLVLLECEFTSVQAAAEFQLPAWASNAQEVTGDQRFANKNLALSSNSP